MTNLKGNLGWAAVAALGATALGIVALSRGETINAVWLVAAASCVYLLAYRFYSLFLAQHVLKLDASRTTPAERFNDGLDYCPTDKSVLFGHHFAAIAAQARSSGRYLRRRWATCQGRFGC